MIYQYHNDLTVAHYTECPGCHQKGFHVKREPTEQQVDVDDVLTAGKWCRYCEYRE